MRNPRLVGIGIAVTVFSGGVTLIVNDYVGWGRGGWSYSRLVLGGGLGLTLIAFGWWPERLAPRVAIGFVGLAMFLYGLASVTGGWLGTAPWQYREVDRTFWLVSHPHAIFDPAFQGAGDRVVVRDPGRWVALSAGLVLCGLALGVAAAWPRLRRVPPST